MGKRQQLAVCTTAVAAAISLALSGCGGGSSPVGSGGSATTQAATPATTQATTPATTAATTPATSPPTTAAPTTTVPPTTTTKPNTTTTTAPKVSKGKEPVAPAHLAAALTVKGPGPFHITPGTSPNNWPEVCDMLTATELTHLDPTQITGLVGKPKGTKAEILGGSGDTKHDTQCRFNVKTSIKTYPGASSYVEISLQEADSLAPSVWREERANEAKNAKKYPGTYALFDLPGGTDCYYDGGELECLKGDDYFYVSGYVEAENSASQLPWVENAFLPIAVKLGSELLP